MNKLFLLIVLSFCISHLIKSQNIEFKEILPPPPSPQIYADFTGISDGSLTFADIDNDRDPDLLITGFGKSIFYLNDGKGNFTEKKETSIIKVKNSSVAFADVDNDNDQDLMIIGESLEPLNELYPEPLRYISKLYLNDGMGNFTEKEGTGFEPLAHGDVKFEDIDGDNDQDLIITGMSQWTLINTTGDPVTQLYRNDGSGNFSQVTHSLPAVGYSSVEFEDTDNDGDPDLFLCGSTGTEKISKLFLNDGDGGFSEKTGSSFEGIAQGSAVFADVNQNNRIDKDLLITGAMNSNGENVPLTELYLNDGKGNYSVDLNFSADSISLGSAVFVDIDKDRDKDLVISGIDTDGNALTKLYLNNGDGDFRPDNNNVFTNLSNSSVAFEDVDSDGDFDLMLAGLENGNSPKTILFLNDGSGKFNEVKTDILKGLENGSSVFADFDGDQDQDIIISGSGQTDYYLNDGSGNFSLVTDISFPGTENGSVISDDFDADGNADLLLTGSGHMQLHMNNGDGTFTIKETSLDTVGRSSIATGDPDNDGDQDVMITGLSHGNYIAKLYLNDGSANFTLYTGRSFRGVEYGTVSFIDVDNDNDEDILITGRDNLWNRNAILYKNEGDLEFTEEKTFLDGVNFGVYMSSVDFADIDNDNDYDLIICGIHEFDPVTFLYKNDGLGNFSKVQEMTFTPAAASGVRFIDANSDGAPDIIVSGYDGTGPKTSFYLNDGSGNFAKYEGLPFMDLRNSNIAIADIDSDEDQDILISGNNGYSDKTKLYRNNTCVITYDSIKVYSCESYSVPSGDETYFSTGIYSDTIPNTEGCDSIISIDLSIGKLDTSVSKSNGTLTSNAEGVNYQWLDCNNNNSEIIGETGKTFQVTQSGSYSVKITQGSCIDTSSCYQIIIEGINPTPKDQQILVYPNPANTEITISGKQLKNIEILNSGGQIIKQMHVNNDEVKIGTEKFTRGIYFIRIITNKLILTRKIILK